MTQGKRALCRFTYAANALLNACTQSQFAAGQVPTSQSAYMTARPRGEPIRQETEEV